jgi:hypothetical protein
MAKFIGNIDGSQGRYVVTVTLGAVIGQQGVVRGESVATSRFSTIDGARQFIKECQPLVNLKVLDMSAEKDSHDADITYLFSGMRFVKSRYNQPIQAMMNESGYQ